MTTDLTARSWLEKLISFDTTSRNSNLALIETVRDYLTTKGLKPELFYSADKNKANLFVTLPADNGATQGGIILSGHTDVVPVDGQKWDTDPFVLTEKDNKLFGRGAADMKGFIATALSLVPEYLSMKRQKPIHLALSYDEEVGCLGAPVMLNELKKRGQIADGCIIGEPTSMNVVVAHKGINLLTCRVHGKAVHSSLTPQGCNAIEHAAQLICYIREVAESFKAQGPYDQYFDVPFTTMTTNRISGGSAVNIIPELCEFSYEFRNLPGMSPDAIKAKIAQYIQEVLLPKMRQEYPEANIDMESIAYAPGLEASEQAAITALAQALTNDNTIRKVAYGTEGGQFQEINIPAIVCGPGNIEQAHKPNEFVAIDQLVTCENFLRKLGHSLV